MNTTILVMGVVMDGDKVLLRKKPEGSMPYKETWYLFGGKLTTDHQDPDQVLKDHLKDVAGIEISITERLGWDTEMKPDHDGNDAFYVYLDTLCQYETGELSWGEGIEKLEWVPIDKLGEYDLVPPSKILFKKMGYL